jgi:hypothetical protein
VVVRFSRNRGLHVPNSRNDDEAGYDGRSDTREMGRGSSGRNGWPAGRLAVERGLHFARAIHWATGTFVPCVWGVFSDRRRSLPFHSRTRFLPAPRPYAPSTNCGRRVGVWSRRIDAFLRHLRGRERWEVARVRSRRPQKMSILVLPALSPEPLTPCRSQSRRRASAPPYFSFISAVDSRKSRSRVIYAVELVVDDAHNLH